MQCPKGLALIVFLFLFLLRFITRQFKGIFQTMYFTFTFLNDTYYIYYLIWNYVNLKYICKFRLVICTQKQAPIELVFALNCSHFYQSEKLFKDPNRVEGFNSMHWHTLVQGIITKEYQKRSKNLVSVQVVAILAVVTLIKDCYKI